jgi:hypothetical protein
MAFVVVALGVHLLEQLRVLDGDRGLRRRSPQTLLVGRGRRRRPCLLSICMTPILRSPCGATIGMHSMLLVPVAGLAVEVGIEAVVRVGVGMLIDATAAEAFAGDAGVAGKRISSAMPPATREKSSSLAGVVKEQRAAVGVEQRVAAP